MRQQSSGSLLGISVVTSLLLFICIFLAFPHASLAQQCIGRDPDTGDTCSANCRPTEIAYCRNVGPRCWCERNPEPQPANRRDAAEDNRRPQSVVDESVQRDLYAGAGLIYSWNLDGDYATPAALTTAALMTKAGRSEDEIIAAVDRLLEQRDDLGERNEWEKSQDYRMNVRLAGGIAGYYLSDDDTARQQSSRSALNLKIMPHEEIARRVKKSVGASNDPHGWMVHDVAGAERNIVDLISSVRNESVFQSVYQTRFSGKKRVGLNDNIDTINQKLTGLSTHAAADFPDIAQDVTQLRERMDNFITESRNERQREARTARARARSRVLRAGNRAGAYLMSTAIGFSRPELGRQLHAVSSTTFQVSDAFRDFKAASKLGDDLTGAASMALSANMVAAGLSLVGVFSNSGPPPEQIILEEIAQVRRDIGNLRKEMHERFGILERMLTDVYSRLDEGLKVLHNELQREIRPRLDDILRNLEDTNKRIIAGTSIILDKIESLRDTIERFELSCVERRRLFSSTVGETQAVSIPPTQDDFAQCVETLYAALRDHTAATNSPPNADVTQAVDLEKRLRSTPDRYTSVSLGKFRNLSPRNIPLPHTAPGPVQWQNLLSLYRQYLTDWPNLATLVNPEGPIEQTISAGNTVVAAFRNAVRRQFQTFSMASAQSDTAIDRLLNGIRGRADVLKKEIVWLTAEYDKEVGRPNDGTVLANREHLRPFPEKFCPYSPKYKNEVIPLEDVMELVPQIARDLVRAKVGRFEYCLRVYYDQVFWEGYGGCSKSRIKRVFWEPPDSKVFRFVAVLNLQGHANIMLADTGKPCGRPTDPGPATMDFHIDYVCDSGVCGNEPLRQRVLNLSVSDDSKKDAHGQPSKKWAKEWINKLALLREDRNTSYKVDPRKEATERLNNMREQLQTAQTRMEIEKSSWIANRLVDEPTDEPQRKLREARVKADKQTADDYAFLSHWLWIGYRQEAQNNDLLTRLIGGAASGPTLTSAVHDIGVQDKLIRNAPDEYYADLERFRSVFQSDAMREVLGQAR